MSKFGSPDEFRHLVDKLHQAGIGVIVDWVPGHFATDPWALQRFDGTALYEHEDPRLGWHPDWGSYIFNFGRNEVKSFLISNAYYWLEEFHIDGLRVDARRLDALSGLLPRGGSVGAQQVRRQRESRSGRAAAADQRSRLRPRARHA